MRFVHASRVLRQGLVPTLLILCGCPLSGPNSHYRPHGHQDMTFAVAPDEESLLFSAAGTGGRDLYVLDLATLQVRRVAETPDYETDPQISPDGKRIVYAAGVAGDRADHIFVADRDGRRRSQLTDADANDTVPRFSPDGSRIVFARDKTHIWGGLAANWSPGGVICVVETAGGPVRQLTLDEEIASAPSFGPDGETVRYFTPRGLFSLRLDGSEPPVRLGPFVRDGSFSADGRRVVSSEGTYSPDQEIVIADLDGTGRSQITSSPNGCWRPAFGNGKGETGDRVYFLMEEWPDGPSGVPTAAIWTVRTDGTDQRLVADRRLFDDPLRWKPVAPP